MFTALIAFAVGVIVGAYSHKWLAKETSAPANLTIQSVGAMAKPAVSAAEKVAQDVAKKV